MSGKQQHFIPQFLLRRFGIRKNTKVTQVTVYDKERGIYVTATDGIGSERFFYSEISADPNVETLDDQITDYEQEKLLAVYENTIRSHEITPEDAAELVAHFTIRPSFVRKAMGEAFNQLLNGVFKSIETEDGLMTFLGLNLERPPTIAREEIARHIQEKVPFSVMAISRPKEALIDEAFQHVKTQKSQIVSNIGPFKALLTKLITELIERVRAAHNNALEKGVSPEQRKDFLRGFSWSLVKANGDPFILPDCLVLASENAGVWQPLLGAGLDLQAIAMPLTPLLCLKGEKVPTVIPSGDKFAEECARSSWDFFVSSKRTQQLAALVPTIRTFTETSIRDAVRFSFDNIHK